MSFSWENEVEVEVDEDEFTARDFGGEFDEGEAFSIASVMDDEGFGGSVDDMANNGGIDFG